MKHLYRCTIVLAGLVLLAPPTFVSADTYYVDAAGSDTANPCTVSGSPCKTITRAVTVATTGTMGSPDIIQVAAGLYDETTNGETFPIAITNDYISLEGAGAATTTIDSDSNGFDLFDVFGQEVSFSGFTFDNATNAIDYSNAAGFTIQNNIFTANTTVGVLGSYSSTDAATSQTVGPMAVLNNQFSTAATGFYYQVQLDFDGSTTGLTATIGAITATGNTFTGMMSGFYFDDIYVQEMDTGTVTVGAINVSNNTLTGCTAGIRFDGLYVRNMADSTINWGNISLNNNTIDDNVTAIQLAGYFGESAQTLTDTSVTLGNMTVNGNTITDNTGYGLRIDYFEANSVYGASSVVFGTFTVDSNTISSQNMVADNEYGIYISDVGGIRRLYDTTTVLTGAVAVTNNTVESENTALYLTHYGVYDLGIDNGSDTVAVTIGPTTVSGNQLTSSDSNGLYFAFEYFGYDQYAQTTLDVGLATVHDNTITAPLDDACDLSYLYESGYEMYNDAEVDIAGLVVTDNTIASTTDDGIFLGLEEIGYGTYDNSTTMVGPTTITGNTITAGGQGIYATLHNIAENTNDSSSVTTGPWNISNNTVTAGDQSFYAYFEYVGYEMNQSSSLMMSPWTVDSNTFHTNAATPIDTVYIEYYEYYVASNMNDDSTATLPDWIITNNDIDAQNGGTGFHFDSYSNPDDNENNAAAHFGSMTISDNIFNQNGDAGMEDAIHFYLEDLCEDCDDSSTGSHGDLTISDNTITNVSEDGIYVDIDELGYAFDNDGQSTMGNTMISGNMINGAEYGIYYEFDDVTPENSGVVTRGTVDITDNTLANISYYGIYSDVDAELDDPTASVTFGQTTISGNSVAPVSTGLQADSLGVAIAEDLGPAVTYPEPSIKGNTSSGFHKGIWVRYNDDAAIRCNIVHNNSTAGLWFSDTAGSFTVANNSFVDNTLALQINTGQTATVEAKNNWWGDVLGPAACTTCNKIDAGAGSVNYTPWLTSVDLGPSCSSAFPWSMFMPAFIPKD